MQDLLATYDAYLLPSAPTARLLACEVWGGGAGEAGAAPTGSAASGGVAAAAAAGTGAAAEAEAPDVSWVAVGEGDLAQARAGLQRYCHADAVGVLRPVPAELRME
jgi:hypothetical protein